MKYTRMPIEIESPEQLGYENIKYNLAESSVTDMNYSELKLDINSLILCYGDHLGKPELRELLVSEYTNLNKENVLLTVGAAAALFMISTSILNTEDHLIIIKPNYATNIETPKAIGCNIDYIDLQLENNFRLDIEKIKSLINPKTKLISLTYPHNPTGVMLNINELKEVIKIAEDNDCYLLYDETYRDMSFGELLPLAASLSEKVISVSSLSKTYGLPGIRMGWVISQDNTLMENLLAAKEQIYICNSVIDEEIAYLFLNRKDEFLPKIKEHINTNFNIVKNFINSQDILEWVEPSGGVVCFPKIKDSLNINIEEFYKTLNEKYKTFVGPGHWFDMDKRFMRIGFGWPDKIQLEEGLKNLLKALQENIS